ncbi:MAG: IscS subfamily cysteine desulfurase [Endomicrobium sp.]|jgi:cysteine desulfurase|nr:IscS subfamily cysteine desulfurase [Endomicrobium sp.]
MEKKKVYLDNSATTAVLPEVIKEMSPFWEDIYGNASSFHSFGRASHRALNEAREKTASFFNASADEIIFTGCGTESDNLAIFGIVNAYGKKGHIITTKIEHHAVLHSCQRLEKLGYGVTYLNVDKDGVISLDEFKKALRPDTMLVTIMHANNEVGSIQPIEKISEILKEENRARKDRIYFHSDCVQTAGKLKLDVEKLGVDMLSVSAHKFNGPKGVGFLYVRRATNIEPITYGGHHENGMRPGTENVAYAAAMAKALEIAYRDIEAHEKRVLFLREKLKNGIAERIPKVIINASADKAVSNILNVSFGYIEGEALLLKLDMQGIAASTGSACATGSSEPSHVLSAMGVDPMYAQGALRFSFSRQNTDEEIDYVLKVLPAAVEELRKMSPVWNKTK